MALLADRVRETATTTGTGTLTLLGAVAGYRTFSASVGSTYDCYYAIVGRGTGEWEVGIGRNAGGNTLTRVTVLASSNSNALVSFSAGTKDVYSTAPAHALGAYVAATVPTVSSTGIGSTGTCVLLSGCSNSDNSGTIELTFNGTGIAASGALTVTFASERSVYPNVIVMPEQGGGGGAAVWSQVAPGAQVPQVTQIATTSFQYTWQMNAAPAAGSTLRLVYWCFGT